MWNLYNGKQNLNAVRLGGQIALLQFNPFSMGLYIQYNRWFGAFDREGMSLGTEFRIYPEENTNLLLVYI